MTVHVQAFIAALRERIVLPVHTFDERLTSSLAAQLLGSNKHPKRDQVSAQIILQNYLDQRQHQGTAKAGAETRPADQQPHRVWSGTA
jgi:RNase H-fold protein (predicted Holliday junction resolvase)